MSLEREFLDHLPVINQVVQFIGRRHRLDPDAIEELQSAIHLKIIDNDYEVLRKFEARSSMRTYLTAVVQRHFLDSRTALWGRWRPCACARRAGPPGVMLDQLLTRDAISLDEAVARVRQRHDLPEPALRSLAAQIPVRTPRRFVGEDVPSDAAMPPVDATLRRDEAQRAESALGAALDALGSEDQIILKYRFVYGLQVSEISRMTGLEQKPLYRRLEGILTVMPGDGGTGPDAGTRDGSGWKPGHRHRRDKGLARTGKAVGASVPVMTDGGERYGSGQQGAKCQTRT